MALFLVAYVYFGNFVGFSVVGVVLVYVVVLFFVVFVVVLVLLLGGLSLVFVVGYVLSRIVMMFVGVMFFC